MAKKKRGPRVTDERGKRGKTPPRKLLGGRLPYVAAAVLVLAGLALVASQRDQGAANPRQPDGAALLRTEAPWEPQTAGLRERVEEAGFPPVGDESFHVHALLSVYVEGEQVPVPANIGIDPQSGFHSPLHTHTPDGVIHFEADDPSPFTVQQVFSMWGVDFGRDRLGAYTPEGENQIHVYVNGEPAADPVNYELREGDNVVVAYGPSGSFPTEPPTDALTRN